MDTLGSENPATEEGGATGHIERTLKREDTTYDVYVGQCNCCSRPVYRVMRTNGAALSIYEISKEDYENVDQYINQIHMSMAVDVIAKLQELRRILNN